MLNFGGEIAKAFEYAVLSEIGYYTGRKIFRIENYTTETSGNYIIYTVTYSGLYSPNHPSGEKILLNFNNFTVIKEDIINWDVENNQLKFRLLTNETLPDYFIEEFQYNDITNTASGLALLKTIQFPMRTSGDILFSYLQSYLCHPNENLNTTRLFFPYYITDFKTTSSGNKRLIDDYYPLYSGFMWFCEPSDIIYKRSLIYFTEVIVNNELSDKWLENDLKVGAYLGDGEWGHSFVMSGTVYDYFPSGGIHYASGESQSGEILPTEKTYTTFLFYLGDYIKEYITSWNELLVSPLNYSPPFPNAGWWYYNKNRLTVKHSDFFPNQNIFNYGNIFFKFNPPMNYTLPADIVFMELSGEDVLTVRYKWFNSTDILVDTAHLYKWNDELFTEVYLTSGDMVFVSGNIWETTFSGNLWLSSGDYVNVRCGDNWGAPGLFKRIGDLKVLEI